MNVTCISQSIDMMTGSSNFQMISNQRQLTCWKIIETCVIVLINKWYSGISNKFSEFSDFKLNIAHHIIYTIRFSFKWSIGPTMNRTSHIKSDLYFRQLFDFLASNHVEVTKFIKNDNYLQNNESLVDINENKINLFESSWAKLFINHVNIQRNRFVAQELKMAVQQSELEFALKPYENCLLLPEINDYRRRGLLETTESSIKIRSWSLILTFGLKKLVHDLNNKCTVPGFSLTNLEDYQIIQPRIKRLRMQDVNQKEEYDKLKSKFIGISNKVYGIYKLYNTVIFLKYNAIRYFYHVNSYYRDQLQSEKQNFEGTDLNIIYKEQIIDKDDACYGVWNGGREIYNIINATSMLDLCLDTISLSYRIKANIKRLAISEGNNAI